MMVMVAFAVLFTKHLTGNEIRVLKALRLFFFFPLPPLRARSDRFCPPSHTTSDIRLTTDYFRAFLFFFVCVCVCACKKREVLMPCGLRRAVAGSNIEKKKGYIYKYSNEGLCVCFCNSCETKMASTHLLQLSVVVTIRQSKTTSSVIAFRLFSLLIVFVFFFF